MNTVNDVTKAIRTRLRRGSLDVRLRKVGTARRGSRMTAIATNIFMYSVIESITEMPDFWWIIQAERCLMQGARFVKDA